MASRSEAPDINIEAEYCPEAVIEWYRITRLKDNKKGARRKDLSLKAKQHLVFLGWTLWYIDKKCKWEMRYTSPRNGKHYTTLKNACESCIKDGSCFVQDPSTSLQAPPTIVSSKTRKRLIYYKEYDQSSSSDDYEDNDTITSTSKEDEEYANQGESEVTSRMENVSEGCSKRGKVLNMSVRKRCTLVYWLIENQVLDSGTNVICRGGNDIVKKGKIFCDGIICDCCHDNFNMTAFEAHACCTRHRPSTSICLEDGRSLLECQREALSSRCEKENRFIGEEKLERYNDTFCLVCGLGGDIILCDQCPSSFHLGCLGLGRVPDGDWFCPTCCCKICYQPKCKQEECVDQRDDNIIIICVQCEQKFHYGCLKAIGFGDMENNGEKKNWFCSVDCGKIFSCLKNMLGKPIKIANNLTWTLFKNVSNGQNESKLNEILGVLQESFDPIVDAITKREMIEDVVFSRYSEHNRSNFSGFYNVILEKMGQVISVATIRIYGPKVAEIVFVATKKQHRRQGMCSLLMDELEKWLTCLEIRSLVLHSSKSTINTWTKSFGFDIMSGNDKCQFINHTFLEFQNTIMCLKSLNRRIRR
ncbi:unnamed protein product [Vicia faba]|uniref:Uncharacterized protein n=1 Tax=Vicia faba TaxID=3906 RepID=A0AAV0ZQS9_VICFA|nr:unnamed protein product [Vicia faba]